MQIRLLKSKIHRAHVTDANLQYVGSITIDAALLEACGMQAYEEVQVVNVNNGERITTYIIEGDRDSGCICLNGAAARKFLKGDEVIIMAYASMTPQEAENFKPQIVFPDADNHLVQK